MSEADLFDLWFAHTDAILTLLFGHFSVTSAFLAVAYLAGKEISRSLSAIVVALYSVMTVALIVSVERHGVAALSVRDELAARGSAWHSLMTEPQAILPITTYALVTTMTVFFVVSILYFFQMRKKHDP